MQDMNKQWKLISRPEKLASLENFRLEELPLEPLAEGQFRVKNHFLSVDPYMRGRMNDGPSYAPPQALGAVMQGGAAGQIIESRHPDFKVGEKVVGRTGWQLYAVSDGQDMRRVSNDRIPLSAWLGCAGMPGMTAWYGVHHIIKPQEGETVVVSAASGAVGSVAGQLARQMGARVVGIAGGPEKCRAVVTEFGFDACVDYKRPDWQQELARATLNRIDGNFENVGGPIWDAILARMNAFGRIALCGVISRYDSESGAPPLQNYASILVNRLRVQGFIFSEHADVLQNVPARLAELIERGQLRYRESISQGIESMPEAFLGLFKGRNFGKQLVRVLED